MVKDLHALIRLRQYQVDEKRRQLGELLGHVAALENGARNLESEIVSEQQAVNSAAEEIGFAYGHYADHAIQRRENFAAQIAETEDLIAVAQDEMREEFRAFKTVEISQENRDRLEAYENARQDQFALDEIGLIAHRRRKKERQKR